MSEMQIRYAVCPLVEFALPRFSGENKGLLVRVRLDVEGPYNEETDSCGGVAKWVTFLFRRPQNYTEVYVAVTDFATEPKVTDFTLQSDHDSCWRDDGVGDALSTAIREAADEVVVRAKCTWAETRLFAVLDGIYNLTLETERRQVQCGRNSFQNQTFLKSFQRGSGVEG